MAPTLHDYGLQRLGREDRLALAEAILDSVAQEMEAEPLDPAHRVELERRLADCIARPDAASPWDEVKARLLSRGRP
jgi:putative addiction module component (TIGR02574 family)